MRDKGKKVRIGVAGAGSISRDFHLPAILKNERAELVALGNLHTESLEFVGRQFAIRKLYSNLTAMAQDTEIDAVINALPNYLHAPITISMLKNGKHVLCEKPMALTVEEAKSMLAAAEGSRRVLAIAYPWRFDEQMNWLRRVVQSGILGTIFRINAHSIVAGAGPPPGSWLRDRKLAGGGALIDVGVHGLNSVAFLFGDNRRPLRVFAKCARHFGLGTTEDTATVFIDFDNSMTVVLEAGWQHPVALEPHGALEVFGVEGYARVFPAQLLCDRATPAELAPPKAYPGSHITPQMYEAQIDGWLDCVLNGAAPRCSGREALTDMQIVDAAYRSAANSTVEEIA